MRSIDLFAGAGGLTRGLEDAGWETVAAVELDEAASRTYRHNFPHVETLTRDIRGVDFTRWRGKADLVAGGPPCQPFSVAGRQRGPEDPRDCVPAFIRAVEQAGPSAFLMENVANLANPRHAEYLADVVTRLERLGYTVAQEVLNAADFGVPQFRRRLFLVGMRGQRFVFPAATHGGRTGRPYADAGTAIAEAEPDAANAAIVTYAKNPVLRPQPFDGMLVNGGGRPINLEEPCQTIPASAGGNRTHIVDRDGVLTAYHRHLLAGGEPRSGIVAGVRRLTVAESAAIQSFHGHEFLGRQSARYAQVGNAVPPGLAAAVGRALREQLLRGEAGAEALGEEAWEAAAREARLRQGRLALLA